MGSIPGARTSWSLARGSSVVRASAGVRALALVLAATGALRADELRGPILTAGYGQPLGAQGSVAWFSGKVPRSELYPGPIVGLSPELGAGSGGGLLVLKERDEDAGRWEKAHAAAERRARALARHEDGQARLAAAPSRRSTARS